ncbi:Sjoegren syndrome/scleroderma autoantigen 1 isoform X2 [Lingula anatina]|nr:Sjoegren syndrome/scleroderma autoantigen 1 isoform X2 [Lingula anatina]XP_023931849.1 Sjoegren syndrome/scleroderma autoantigen 1 isoform X2 [Lingula anatina]|eukprot:XP_013421369.1 Sjoegren syndrome/scleroderma autoantigen 1 isoform X2 [Lingula anatina]
MKLIQARRERSDKISKIMGDYLLKGYKMLGSSCELCGTILLRDRQSQDYCVGCNDLESDTDKDNPAVNTEAARSHEREYGLFPRSHLPQSSSDSPMEAAAPLTAPVSVSVLSQTQQVAGLSGVNCQPGDSRREVSSGLIALTANTVVDAPLGSSV